MRDLTSLLILADRGRQIRDNHRPTAAGRVRRPGLKVQNADGGGRTTVRLYGPIGQSWWDDTAVSATDLAEALDTIGPGGIDLHINSPGGDAFDAVAMHAALLNHPSDVATYVDGIAASAASMIAMAGDRIVIEKPARFMIHDAASFAYGPPAAVLKLFEILDGISDSIAEMYADRAGGTLSTWRDRMKAETWYSAQQAVDVGLADEVANDRTAQPAEPAEDDEPEPAEDTAPVEDARTNGIRARARLALALKG